MTAATAIETRPLDPATERNYVLSSVCRSLISFYGGEWAHAPTVSRHVNDLLPQLNVQVAVLPGESDILGFAAWASDGTVEFMHLRKPLVDNGRDEHGFTYRGGVGPHGGTDRHWEPTPLALRVVKALLPQRIVIMRRPPLTSWMMQAVIKAGYAPSVIPRGV